MCFKKFMMVFVFMVWSVGALTVAVAQSSREKTTKINPPPHDPPYPARWWTPVNDPHAPSWEIFPQAALYGEVILSKRNELGLLSNFAATPFVYGGKKFASVEGFWQATKYPEDVNDPRARFPGIHWPYTRAQVEAMTAFQAKHAGDVGTDNMKIMGIDWVSFQGRRFIYREAGDSDFYKLIVKVMWEKLKQNPPVRRVLLQTGDLRLLPDHEPGPAELKAWRYFDIWMDIRSRISNSGSPAGLGRP